MTDPIERDELLRRLEAYRDVHWMPTGTGLTMPDEDRRAVVQAAIAVLRALPAIGTCLTEEEEELLFLWREFALADDDTLTGDAQRLKQALLRLIDPDTRWGCTCATCHIWHEVIGATNGECWWDSETIVKTPPAHYCAAWRAKA